MSVALYPFNTQARIAFHQLQHNRWTPKLIDHNIARHVELAQRGAPIAQLLSGNHLTCAMIHALRPVIIFKPKPQALRRHLLQCRINRRPNGIAASEKFSRAKVAGQLPAYLICGVIPPGKIAAKAGKIATLNGLEWFLTGHLILNI